MNSPIKKKKKWRGGAWLRPAGNPANYTAPKSMKGRGKKYSSICGGNGLERKDNLREVTGGGE